MFPSPIDNPEIINAIKHRKQFKVSITWANGEKFKPEYEPDWRKVQLGEYVIVHFSGEYNIAIVSNLRIESGNKFVKLQSIPAKKDIRKEQSYPSKEVYWYNVRAKLVR